MPKSLSTEKNIKWRKDLKPTISTIIPWAYHEWGLSQYSNQDSKKHLGIIWNHLTKLTSPMIFLMKYLVIKSISIYQ